MPTLPPARIGRPAVRHRLMVASILLAILALAARLVWVQGLNSEALAAQAQDARETTRTIPALRGEIRDRDGTVLASSVERYDLWVNQVQVRDYLARDSKASDKGAPAAAKLLAPVLGLSIEDTVKKLTGSRQFVYLAKGVDPTVRDAVLSQRIPGIGADRVADRIYPAGQVGGNVVGFVDGAGTAQGGIELADDDLLQGRDGTTRYERGASGQIIPTGTQSVTPAVDGQDVVLTLDRDLQWKAQEQIAAAVQQNGGTGGSIVALNARTGEVLALADYPTYDPNDVGATPAEYRGNQSISNIFDPGSTGKLFTMAAAIDQGTATPASQYTAPYTMEFRGNRIKDSHPHETQRLTVAGVLKNSSNTGTVQIAETMTPEVRHDYLRAFGLGQKTGIELPMESAGLLPPTSKWNGRTRYTTAFGQGYSVTALQVVSSIGTFANDGVRVQPTIVRGVAEADGSIRAVAPREQTRVISSETAHTMVQLMDNDIADDGSNNAGIPQYAVAGKTGTAQAADGTYTASFIGFAPADDPEIVVGVFVYGIPTFISGNTAAAPTWSRFMEFALQNQRIAPTGKPGTELPNEW